MERILVGLDLLSPLRGILWVPHRQLLPMIYTIDFKAILGQFIQRWSRELTRIDDVAIPCLLLHLDSLPLLHLDSLPPTLPCPIYNSPYTPP